MSGISSNPNWRRLLPKGLAVIGLLSAAGFGISHFFASPETENSNIVRGEGARNLRFEGNQATPQAQRGKRVALIIGNSNYQHVSKLDNPVNDAEDIAKALRQFGFKVMLHKNLELRAMRDAIAEFGRESGNAEAALFYYAGHGVQSKSLNYLVPVAANARTEADFEYEAVNLNYLLDTLDNTGSHAKIVMLDACRNNPFGSARSSTRGLAALSQIPRGTVIVYATDPGNTAEDGQGRNAPFTAGLLKAFKGNDLSLDGVLTVASAEVEKATNNQQVPYVNGPQTLKKNFHFAVTVNPGPKQVESEFWASIKDSRDPADFEAYLKQYPQGNFRPLAENRLKQLKTPPPAAPQALLPGPVVPAVLPPAITEKPAVTVPPAGKPASPPSSVPVTEKPVVPPPAAKPATPAVPEKPAATTVLPATPAPTTVKPAMPAPVPAKPAVPAVPVVPAVPAKPATPAPVPAKPAVPAVPVVVPAVPAKPATPPPVPAKPATPAPAPAKPTASTPAEKPAAPAVKKPAEAAPAKKPAVEPPEKPAKKQVTHPVTEKPARKKPSASNEKEETSSSRTKPSHAETSEKPAPQPAPQPKENSTGILFRSQERWY